MSKPEIKKSEGRIYPGKGRIYPGRHLYEFSRQHYVVLRTFRMSGKEFVKERVSEGKS